jgi:site-specific DNA recombinase
VLDECFADLLKGLVFDDQVMDWIVEALHQSHADEKRFREDAIIRLQEEQSKIQNRLDRLYDDRLDGFIEPDFFERKSREWRQTQKRLADQITESQEAANDYVQDGIRLLELSKRPIFSINSKIQAKTKIAQFRVFELNMEGPHSHRDVSPTV